MSRSAGRNLRVRGRCSDPEPSVLAAAGRTLRDRGRQDDHDPSDCVHPQPAHRPRHGAVA